jgi:hypothetical protein
MHLLRPPEHLRGLCAVPRGELRRHRRWLRRQLGLALALAALAFAAPARLLRRRAGPLCLFDDVLCPRWPETAGLGR